jgi:hypothetical protein
MNVWAQRLAAVTCVLLSVGLLIWSSPDARGYEFPRMVALTMVVLSVGLAVMAFKPGKLLMVADIESIPIRIIWPMLVILLGLAFLAPRLGFFSTSFLVFMATVLVFSPERFTLRRLGMMVFVGLCFTFALYLLFVLLLNVHLPRALLF